MNLTDQLITSDEALDALVDTLLSEPRYALDTEFHRERTYHPRLALVQVAWAGGSALLDPLAVDVTRLRRLLDGPPLANKDSRKFTTPGDNGTGTNDWVLVLERAEVAVENASATSQSPAYNYD